ncbi:MAG: DUF2180 family protein [Desulfobulbales bacterium]|nr:DUF2180 family protein [Desulfobulbales bacterium]
MKCYNHPESEAVAVCLACGKGVCRQCVFASENAVSCREKCSAVLSSRDELQARQAAHLKNVKRMNLLGSLFSLGMGALFIYFSYQGFGLVYDFVFLLGAGFAVYGIVALCVNMFIFIKVKMKK